MAPKRVYTVVHRAFRPDLDTRDLPDGVCGRVTGVALVYDVEDAYGTRFARGCLDRTKREKLAAGKVSLFADHEYGIRTHVGVVRTLTTAGGEEMLAADLFDTEDGRHAKEYLEAVVRSGAYTGFSIGFFNRSASGDPDLFTEIELDEVSITPRPAVPGADVVGVRKDIQAAWRMLDTALAVLPLQDVHARVTALIEGNAEGSDRADAGRTPAEDPDAVTDDSPAPVDPELATWDARRQALAALYRMEMVSHEADQERQGQ